MSGSNRRPPACKAGALPTELTPRFPKGDRAGVGYRRRRRAPRRSSSRRPSENAPGSRTNGASETSPSSSSGGSETGGAPASVRARFRRRISSSFAAIVSPRSRSSWRVRREEQLGGGEVRLALLELGKLLGEQLGRVDDGLALLHDLLASGERGLAGTELLLAAVELERPLLEPLDQLRARPCRGRPARGADASRARPRASSPRRGGRQPRGGASRSSRARGGALRTPRTRSPAGRVGTCRNGTRAVTRRTRARRRANAGKTAGETIRLRGRAGLRPVPYGRSRRARRTGSVPALRGARPTASAARSSIRLISSITCGSRPIVASERQRIAPALAELVDLPVDVVYQRGHTAANAAFRTSHSVARPAPVNPS